MQVHDVACLKAFGWSHSTNCRVPHTTQRLLKFRLARTQPTPKRLKLNACIDACSGMIARADCAAVPDYNFHVSMSVRTKRTSAVPRPNHLWMATATSAPRAAADKNSNSCCDSRRRGNDRSAECLQSLLPDNYSKSNT